MVQKGKYIDFQEVNPSPLHFEAMQDRCKNSAVRSAKPHPVQPREERLYTSTPKFKLSAPTISPRVKELLLIVLGVAASCAVMGWLLIQLALLVRRWAIALWAWMIESNLFLYLAVGVCFVGLVYLAFWMNGQVKSARPFTDYQEPKAPTKTHGQTGVIINHHYHINK